MQLEEKERHKFQNRRLHRAAKKEFKLVLRLSVEIENKLNIQLFLSEDRNAELNANFLEVNREMQIYFRIVLSSTWISYFFLSIHVLWNIVLNRWTGANSEKEVDRNGWHSFPLTLTERNATVSEELCCAKSTRFTKGKMKTPTDVSTRSRFEEKSLIQTETLIPNSIIHQWSLWEFGCYHLSEIGIICFSLEMFNCSFVFFYVGSLV